MGRGARLLTALTCILSVALADDKCQSENDCGECVETPGCSWFYNTPNGDFCSAIPTEGSGGPVLENRSPYKISHDVKVDQNRPLNLISRNRRARVYITPQVETVVQSVGMRQEVTFKVATYKDKLAFRVIDRSDHGALYTVVAAQPNICKTFKLMASGYSKANMPMSRIVDGKKEKFKGDKSYLKVVCERDLSKQNSKATEFKLILDTPHCFKGQVEMKLEMPWQTKERALINVAIGGGCKCPCEEKNSTLSYVQDCDKGGKHGGKTRQRRSSRAHKQDNCTYENDKCYGAPFTNICSGNGYCLCGKCLCEPGYYGDHCECNDQTCPSSNGQMCGGPLRGKCDCGKCRCIGKRSGEACELDYIPDTCRRGDHGPACGGHGSCINGKCQCHHMVSGDFCENNDKCADFRHCAECYVKSFDDFSMDRFCQRCKNPEELRKVKYRGLKRRHKGEKLPCHFEDSQGCGVNYTYEQHKRNKAKTIVFVDKLDCPNKK